MNLSITIQTINIISLRDPTRREALTYFLDQTDAHAIIISENNESEDNLRRWLQFSGPSNGRWIAHAPKDATNQSVAILLRHELDVYTARAPEWHSPRLARLSFSFRRNHLSLIACYHPTLSNQPTNTRNPDDPLRLASRIRRWCQQDARNNTDTIVAGDLNGCISPGLERQTTRADGSEVEHGADAETPLLQLVASDSLLADPFRIRNPSARGFTRLRTDERYLTCSRLDYILTSPSLEPRVTDIDVIWSPPGLDILNLDHAVVSLRFACQHYLIPPAPAHRRGWDDQPTKRIDAKKITTEDWKAFVDALRSRGVPATSGLSTLDDTDTAISSIISTLATATLPHRRVGPPVNVKQHRYSTAFMAVKSLTSRSARQVRESQTALDDLLATLRRRFPSLQPLWSDHARRYRNNRGSFVPQLRERLLRIESQRLTATAHLARLEYQIQRDEEFASSPRKYLRNLLGKHSNPDPLLVVRTAAGLEDRPAAVKDLTRTNFLEWTPESTPFSLDGFDDWHQSYQPLAAIPDDAFTPVAALISLDEASAAARTSSNLKAPGPSGIQAAVLRHALEAINEDVVALFNRCLQLGQVPRAWCTAHMQPIPKPDSRPGDLTRLRPIMLLESMRKLFFRILADRITTCAQTHDVLRGNQVGFTPGMQGQDAIALIRATIDYANREKRLLFVVSFDIRRAFDSVSRTSLLASMRRIKLPQELLDILDFIQRERVVYVRTAHGMTDPYQPRNGVDQGDTLSPLLWLIFYDTLLCKLQDSGHGFLFNADPAGPSATSPGALPPTKIGCIAMADDLTLLAGSTTDLHALVDIVDSFMLLHKITVNGDKSIIAVNRASDSLDFPSPIEMRSSPGRPVVDIRPRDVPFRVLGSLLRLDGKPTDAIAQMKMRGKGFAASLAPRRISADIAIYITNMVIIPAVSYRAWGQAISDINIDAVEITWRSMLKNKLGLPRSVPNAFLFGKASYRVASLADTIDNMIIGETTRHLHLNHPVGMAVRQNLRSLQRHLHRDAFPLASAAPSLRLYADYMGWLLHRLTIRGLTIQPAKAELAFTRPLTHDGPALETIAAADSSAADLAAIHSLSRGQNSRLFTQEGDSILPLPSARKRKARNTDADYTPKRQRIFAYNLERITPSQPKTPAAKARISHALQSIPRHRLPGTAPAVEAPSLSSSHHLQLLDGGLPVTPSRKRKADHPALQRPLRRAIAPPDPSRPPLILRIGPPRPDRPRLTLRIRAPAATEPAVIPPPGTSIRFLQETRPPRPTKPLSIQKMVDEAQRQIPFDVFWARMLAPTTAPLIIYTDGSVKDGRGGYAVAFDLPRDDSDSPRNCILGAYDGPALSSIRLEALAILHAIAATPGHVDLVIHTDSLVGIHAYELFVQRRVRNHIGRRRKHPDACIWNLVHALVNNRAGAVTLEHVKAHTGVDGNEFADKQANAARTSCTFAWDARDLYAPENRFRLAIAGFVTTRPVRMDLGEQARHLRDSELETAIRKHLPAVLHDNVLVPARLDLSARTRREIGASMGSTTRQDDKDKTTGKTPETATADPSAETVANPRHTNQDDNNSASDDDVEDDDMLQLLFPDLSARRRALRRERGSHRTAFHLKLIYDYLPTSLRWFNWRPDLVPDGKCRRCGRAEESRSHLRECDKVSPETCEQFAAAFRTAVERATRRPVRTRRWLSRLSSTGELIAVDWLFLGVIPVPEVARLSELTDLPVARARLAILAGLVAAREVFLELIWRPRCRETLQWERSQGITMKMKRSAAPPSGTSSIRPYLGRDDAVLSVAGDPTGNVVLPLSPGLGLAGGINQVPGREDTTPGARGGPSGVAVPPISPGLGLAREVNPLLVCHVAALAHFSVTEQARRGVGATSPPPGCIDGNGSARVSVTVPRPMSPPSQRPLDKLKERWKLSGRTTLDSTYGAWTFRPLGGDS
jgi:ribonuclease HI/exonuclease III